MGRETFSRNPVGTGPYELASWKPKTHVALTSFSGYWGAAPKMKNITFLPIVEDTTCETALKTGEINVGRSSMINVGSFKADPRFQVVSKPGVCPADRGGRRRNRPRKTPPDLYRRPESHGPGLLGHMADPRHPVLDLSGQPGPRRRIPQRPPGPVDHQHQMTTGFHTFILKSCRCGSA